MLNPPTSFHTSLQNPNKKYRKADELEFLAPRLFAMAHTLGLSLTVKLFCTGESYAVVLSFFCLFIWSAHSCVLVNGVCGCVVAKLASCVSCLLCAQTLHPSLTVKLFCTGE